MYTQLKNKDSNKTKDKTKRISIDEGIPAAPDISDFQLTDFLVTSSVEEEKFNLTSRELLSAVNELDSGKIEDGKPVSETAPEKSLTPETDCNKRENGNLENNSDPIYILSEDHAENNYLSCIENETELEVTRKELPDDSSKIINYNTLGTTVKKCMIEISQPSAPIVEKTVPPITSPLGNLTQHQEKNVISEKPLDISKYNFIMTIEDALPPFSDEKLSEFYYNPELSESKNYVDEFINQEINNSARGNNPLYKILVDYMQSKNKLKANETQIEELKEKIKVCVASMWTIWSDVQVTEKEKCSDGNVVSFVEKYTQAQFNPQIYKEYSSLLTEIKHLVHEVYIMNSFTCSLLKLKIEYYFQCLLTPCPEFTNLEEQSSAVLTSSLVNSHFQKCLLDLKVAISTLFIFQRKQTLDVNNSFLEETRQWLTDLVSVLLRVGSWKDHIFLLNHIMRCPGGVSEWGAQFIQLPYTKLPVDPFNSFELNHMMAVMNILLSPIEQRENFIKKWESELANDVNPWTVIDSDGEVEDDDQCSCPMKENDLVSFLNQIPFSHMFRAILRFDALEANGTVTSEYLLRLFSFFTNLIKILLSGLKLYSTQKYRQFTKRLGRLIYHIVQYATDSVTVFKSQSVFENEMMRIQTEYDNFFLRSTKFIYSAKKHGTWQFLATVPYHMASSNTILKLYGILQLNDNYEERIVKINFQHFEEKFVQLPEEEQFYLLTTFANMALARDVIEIQFIKNVLLQLFYIGFLSPATMDHCYKNVKSLLCSLCSSYPFLISEIILIQKNKFLSSPEFDQNLSMYLWMKLPLEDWLPDNRDLETLSSWLLEPIQSVQNELARIILQSMNYGMCRGDLFMPLYHHQSIAYMILKANSKLVFDYDVGVIKNVSNLVRSQSSEQTFNDWSWNVLLKLRLHLLDRSEAEICRRLYNLTDYLSEIPDLDSNPELQFLVLKNHTMACYVALMTTTLGHSVPIIFEKGFEMVDVVLNAGKYEAGIACLEYMTLLFLDCKDSLYKCEKFIFLLSRLMAADNSYVQFAKNLISNNFPGPVLRCMESMIQNQLNCCKAVDLKKFSSVIVLWLLTLTKLPLWTQVPGVLYLIDKLLQNSLFDAVSTKIVNAVLEDLLEENSPPSETKSSFSSLVSWMNSKYVPPSLLPKGFNGEVPWFSYRIIQMEFEIYEKKTSLWAELLKELLSSSGKKTNIDNSLKKVCGNLKIPPRPSSALAVYKWSYQILETDISHPLVPLLWQRFFHLYLYRVPGLTDRGSVSRKFFDGVINQALFKRLKQRLEETCEHFKTHTEHEGLDQDYYLKCYKLLQTYTLWLDDPKLHDSCLSVHLLPVQYNPEFLQMLIYGNETPWVEFLEYQNMEKSFVKGSLMWSKVRNRPGSGKEKKIGGRQKEKLPLNKISERLNSYENPLPPPKVNLKKYNFPRINLDTLMNSDKMILSVKSHLKVLLQYINYYTSEVNENVALACDMQELLPRLYITAEAKKVLKGHCTGIYKTVNGKSVHYSCSGPAVVQLTYEESKLNDQIKQHFGQCDKAFETNIQKATSVFPPNLTTSAVLIDIMIQELKREYDAAKTIEDNEKISRNLRNSGVHLFYELVRTWCESITHTPPLDKAFENYMEALGKSFVEGNAEENDRILHLILSDDIFGDKISRYYTPNASETHDFIESYSKGLKCGSEKRFMILSKFDLSQWLTEKKPKYLERSRMISKIGQGLKSVSGFPEEKSTLKLLNQHLEVLLMYDFPEHYGEVLNFLIEASESQSISSSCWFMFLNSLALGHFAFCEGRIDQNIFEPGQSVKKLKYYFSKFATDQNLIPFEVIQGTISLLVSTFKNERLKTGHKGLYRKYRLYVEPICIFFGMLSYSCVAKALEIDTGSLSDKITQQLWPLISDLYSPWLSPCWVENDKQETGSWIQEQTSERSIFLPWTTNDSCHASFCASIFVESVRFVFDALPGLNHVLSYVWFFYVSNFANIYVKDYILNVIHDNLFSLPWETFVPSLQDVELMLKVVDQFLPLSHSFLGSIFVNIKWTELVRYYLSYYDVETTTKLHICLLHLLVKLPLEPSLKQSEKITTLLIEANDYAWHLLDHNSYDVVLNWFIMSCDPRIILMDERLEYYKLDSTILRLLRSCAGFVPNAKNFHPTTLSKRLMYVRACIKWLITSNRRFKSRDSPLFKSALCNMWNEMESVINETVPQKQKVDEAGILMSEFLTIFAEPELSPIVETALSNWLSARQSSILILGLFRSVGVSVDNPNIYGSIIESSLESYFNFAENCDWTEVTNILVPFSKSKSDAHLDKVFMDNNYILTLYAALHKRFHREGGFSFKLALTDLLQFLSEVKPSSSLEPKLVLLILFGLKLVDKEMKLSPKEGISFLIKFSDTLSNFVNDKGYGFLSAIGLKKPATSNRFKLVCLVVCGGTAVFLNNSYPEYQEAVDEKLLQALESAENNKAYQNIQQYASYAKTAVREMSSVQQIINFLQHIGLKLFNKLYLK